MIYKDGLDAIGILSEHTRDSNVTRSLFKTGLPNSRTGNYYNRCLVRHFRYGIYVTLKRNDNSATVVPPRLSILEYYCPAHLEGYSGQIRHSWDAAVLRPSPRTVGSVTGPMRRRGSRATSMTGKLLYQNQR